MKYASTEDGTPIYVQTHTSWGRSYDNLVLAASLKEARAKYGWSGMQHTTTKVRRATVDDVERIGIRRLENR